MYDFYKKFMEEIETHTQFNRVLSSKVTKEDLNYAPMILIIGPYSAGKTTFIKYLCKKDIPNMNIGPEPSTEKFSPIFWGENEGVIPGESLTIFPYLPFKNLEKFGSDFLARFEGVMLDAKILKEVTFIDTPGMQSSGISVAGRN